MKTAPLVGMTLVAVACLTLNCPVSSEAAQYTFNIVADNRGPINSFGQATINNVGTIAFGTSKDGGGGGYFIGNGAALQEIPFSSGTPPQINNNGTIVLNHRNEAILTYNNGVTTNIADRAGIYASLGVPSINDSGAVVFHSTLDTGGEGIFVSSDGVVTEIVNTQGQFNSFGLFADMNNSGTVVFTGSLDTGERGIFTAHGGQITTIHALGASRASINNQGTVAARSELGFVVLGPQSNYVIDDSSGPISHLIGAPALNNRNNLAFRAAMEDGRHALFIADHLGSLERIVATGDTITNGLTLVGFAGEHDYPGWLNDKGQIVFWAYLSDGSEAMIVASPAPINPPTCSAARAFPDVLWAPNHQFVPIVVMGVTDPEGDAVTITVTGVTQDEPVNGKGDGNTSPDAVIQAGSASVRAERSGNGNGRVYQVSFRADDGQGGFCTGAVWVGVPHSRKQGLIAIDDGQVYDSTIP